jgi:hypothetical protein
LVSEIIIDQRYDIMISNVVAIQIYGKYHAMAKFTMKTVGKRKGPEHPSLQEIDEFLKMGAALRASPSAGSLLNRDLLLSSPWLY